MAEKATDTADGRKFAQLMLRTIALFDVLVFQTFSCHAKADAESLFLKRGRDKKFICCRLEELESISTNKESQ